METLILEKDIGPKPAWFRIKPPTKTFHTIKETIQKKSLHTVCEESHCPNMAECWSGGTTTFMVMGDTCTRGCRFCNIKTALKGQPVDPEEPKKLVKALEEMNVFDYIVITSVDRDDLRDQGSNHFASCIKAIKQSNKEMLVEVLIPDFQGNLKLLQNVTDAQPDVIGHNLETVKRLQSRVRDRKANYHQSLEVLKNVKKLSPDIITKSSIMLGLGEKKEEVLQAMKDLRNIKVEILTLGQYLRPSKKHLAVQEYITPETYEYYKQQGKKLGFKFVAADPFVRSSYKAGELFIKNFLKEKIQRGIKSKAAAET